MNVVPIRVAPRVLLRLIAVCALHSTAQAQIGPSGPIGPVGSTGTTGQSERAAKPSQPAASAPVPGRQTPREVNGNRLEVTGNTATQVGCGPANTAVNSIDVNAQRLEGRTVIVQGRNSSDVNVQPCPTNEGKTNKAAPARPHDTQVNSIRVR
ncbi:hypothetical protein [Acidovorax sp. WCS2018Cala2-18]|nr:hypothetical protein [Acidovorax sp. WCS2018Cala2-18]